MLKTGQNDKFNVNDSNGIASLDLYKSPSAVHSFKIKMQLFICLILVTRWDEVNENICNGS